MAHFWAEAIITFFYCLFIPIIVWSVQAARKCTAQQKNHSLNLQTLHLLSWQGSNFQSAAGHSSRLLSTRGGEEILFTDGVFGGNVKSPPLSNSQEMQRIISLDVLKSFLIWYCADLPMVFHPDALWLAFMPNCFCSDAMQCNANTVAVSP